jgi:hypothetical protein
VIPNITRGEDFRGLMRYLVGPGKRNEHTMPHLVAGESALMTWFDSSVLSPAAAAELADELRLPTRMRRSGPEAGSVWHCSLSLPAQDGVFTDEQWAHVAYTFLDKMGWTPEVSGRSPMPWLAVHHGPSAGGNDHIHLVVSAVREDGTFVNVHKDQPRAQQACRELEVELGIQQLEGRPLGIAEPGLSAAELGISARTGREPSRRKLERAVRAAAGAADGEAAFVRLVREAGLRIAPYFAVGRHDVVAGYRVGLRGEGERMFGGGHLSRDLTLPRLRQRWPDTPGAHLAAAEEWRIADRGDRIGEHVVDGGFAVPAVDPDMVNRALYEQRERLRTLPIEDTLSWSIVAHDVAGVLAAWSSEVENEGPGPIAKAALAVRRLAQIRRCTASGTVPPRAAAGAALLGYSISRGGQGRIGQAIFLRQLLNTMKALHDTAVAMSQLRIAEAIQRSAVQDLRALQASLPDLPDEVFRTGCPTVAAVEAAVNGVRKGGPGTIGKPRPLGQPIPKRVEQPHQRTGRGRSSDFER